VLWYARRTDSKANISHCSPGLYFSLAHDSTTSGPRFTYTRFDRVYPKYLLRFGIEGVVGGGSDVSVLPVVVVSDGTIYTCKCYIFIYIYIYSGKERERSSERERQRQTETVSEGRVTRRGVERYLLCVCVCVWRRRVAATDFSGLNRVIGLTDGYGLSNAFDWELGHPVKTVAAAAAGNPLGTIFMMCTPMLKTATAVVVVNATECIP